MECDFTLMLELDLHYLGVNVDFVISLFDWRWSAGLRPRGLDIHLGPTYLGLGWRIGVIDMDKTFYRF